MQFEHFVINLEPGQSGGTCWQRKNDNSSVYLDLENSSFEGTIGVSIYGRNQEFEINCTYLAPSFQLSSGKKYCLFNLVHENELTEAKLLFYITPSMKPVEIRGKWCPDSEGDDNCIVVTGRNTEYNTKKNNYDRHIQIGSNKRRCRTTFEPKFDKTSIYLNLENSHFAGSAKVFIMGWNKGSPIKNFTNEKEYFLVESGKKYFLKNQVNNNYYPYTFLEFEKENENDIIQGIWSPDSTAEDNCIIITGEEIQNTQNSTNCKDFLIASGKKQGQTSVEPKIDKSSIYLNLENSHFFGCAKVYIMGQNQNGMAHNFTNGGDYFLVESERKYLLYNQVKENYYDYAFLKLEKERENDVIQGYWSPNSSNENDCILIKKASIVNDSNENFVIQLNPGQLSGTKWRRKIDNSSVYLNLQQSTFQGTVDVSIYGRKRGYPEKNCTYKVSSFHLSSGAKYFLFNSVNEDPDELTECRIVFSTPSCNNQIEIRGYWSPDSTPESGCIEITGENNNKTCISENNFSGCQIEPASKADFLIDVPYISNLSIPEGCEGLSATMLLQYFGFNITAKNFINSYIPRENWDSQTAPDPNEAYIGDPYISTGYNCGFGCYAECIAKSINKLILDREAGNALHAQAYFGESISSLMSHVNSGIPVLIWATMNMKPSSTKNTKTWTLRNGIRKGSKFTWIAGEHCLVLVGYNSRSYFFNDPYKSNGVIGFPKDIVNQRYNELGQQSVVVYKTLHLQHLETEKLLEYANKVIKSIDIIDEIKYLGFEMPFSNSKVFGTISISIGDKMKFGNAGDIAVQINNGKLSGNIKIPGQCIDKNDLFAQLSNLYASINAPLFNLNKKLSDFAATIGVGNVSFSITGDGYFKVSITSTVPIISSRSFNYSRTMTITIKYKYHKPHSNAPAIQLAPVSELIKDPKTYVSIGFLAVAGLFITAGVGFVGTGTAVIGGAASLACAAVGSIFSFLSQFGE